MSTNAASVNPTSAAISFGALTLLCGCFILSGVAALVYQTAWTRQFAIVFGTSELAVATVLAAYMGGLALGAFLAERFVPRVTRPVLTYAFLEIGIAASAVFAVPFFLWASDLALRALFGGQATPPSSDHTATTVFYLGSAFVALALPTTLMGATLPMLARYAVAEERQIGRRIGLLYAMNTAGAVVGALCTAFLLLPELGLTRTIWVGATLNGIVFLLAVGLSRSVPYTAPPKGYELDATPAPRAAPPPRTVSFRALPGAAWVLPLMLLAGAVAFFQEVLWTRMLSHVVGSSIYSFGVMVASFLVGIAAGGGLGAAIARTRAAASTALGIALVVAAVAGAVAYLQLESRLPEMAGLLRNVWFCVMLLLPMTIAIGATYPLAVRVLASDANDAAPASARVYAWNTVGAIAGSLAAGFVLIPALKYEGAIRVAVCTSALLGAAALWMLPQVNRWVAVVASLAAAGLCLPQAFAPATPRKLLVTSPLNVGTSGRVLYYDVGRSASVVMLAQEGGLALRTNGLPEALMDGPGGVPRFSGEFWLSPLAVIARPEATDMLIVGFGGGVVVEGVPPSIRKVDVIELEPKVIEANRATAALRRRNPLTDSRVNIISNDARGALRLTSHRYDAIVSQPSHPWTAGASHLYTREFMQLAHEHLVPNGVFVQWMNVIFMDEELLRSLTATLLSVFAEVRVYRPDPNTIVFLASDAPLELEQQLARTGMPIRHAPLHYARYGLSIAEDLVAALVLDSAGARRLAAGAPLITDDDNRIATSSVWEKQRGMSGESSGRVLAAEDPLQRADSFVYGELRGRLDFAHIMRRNGVFVGLDPSIADRIARAARLLGDTPEGALARAYYYRVKRQVQQSTEVLKFAIEEFPEDAGLRLEYLRPYFGQLANGDAPADIVEAARKLDGHGARLVEVARAAAHSQWPAVAAAEPELARVPWTHAWYPEAIELRASWRTHVTNPDQKRRFGDECVVMIDRLVIMYPTLNLYGLRARAGLSAGRPEVIAESVANYARLAAGIAGTGGASAGTLRQDAQALRAMLAQADEMPGADRARIEEIRAEIARTLDRK